MGSSTYFAHRDIEGNVIALTGTNSSLARTYDYGAFGTSEGGTDYANFAGKDRARFKGALSFGDGVADLYYMRNRWFEPGTGRFLSEDPLGLEGGINPYVFAQDDPVNARDPNGLDMGLTCADFEGYAFIENGVAVPCSQDRVDALNGWFHERYFFGLLDAVNGTRVPLPGYTDGCTFTGADPACDPGAWFRYGDGTCAPQYTLEMCDEFYSATSLLYHSDNFWNDQGGRCSDLAFNATNRMAAGRYTWGGDQGSQAGEAYAPYGPRGEVELDAAAFVSSFGLWAWIVHEEVHQVLGPNSDPQAYAAMPRCP